MHKRGCMRFHYLHQQIRDAVVQEGAWKGLVLP